MADTTPQPQQKRLRLIARCPQRQLITLIVDTTTHIIVDHTNTEINIKEKKRRKSVVSANVQEYRQRDASPKMGVAEEQTIAQADRAAKEMTTHPARRKQVVIQVVIDGRDLR